MKKHVAKLTILLIWVLLLIIPIDSSFAKKLMIVNQGNGCRVEIFSTDIAPSNGTLEFHILLGNEGTRLDEQIHTVWHIDEGEQINNTYISNLPAPRYARLWWQPNDTNEWYLLPSQYWHNSGNLESEYGISCEGDQPSYHTSFSDAISEIDVCFDPYTSCYIPKPLEPILGTLLIGADKSNDGGFDTYTLDISTLEETLIFQSTYSTTYYPLEWSPDQSKIVLGSITGNSGNSQEIFLINSNGSGFTQITNNSRMDAVPKWSPDGSQLVITCAIGGGTKSDWEICILNLDEMSRVAITDNSVHDSNPDWSPDGTKIVFNSAVVGPDEFDVFVMNTDGTNPTRLTDHEAIDGAPVWSPDGSKIAFFSDRDHPNFDIYIMNADGANVERVTTFGTGWGGVVWSPDGMKIAFTSSHEGVGQEIYISNIDGTDVRRITNNTYEEYVADWIP